MAARCRVKTLTLTLSQREREPLAVGFPDSLLAFRWLQIAQEAGGHRLKNGVDFVELAVFGLAEDRVGGLIGPDATN